VSGKNLTISRTERETLKFISNHSWFKSQFSFLKSQNGFRKGKMHLLIGPTGSGKTTFTRSLLIDMIENNPDKKILLYLSEESLEDLKIELSKSDFSFQGKTNVYIISEQDDAMESVNEFFTKVDGCVTKNEIDIIIFDNITTSDFYNDASVRDQGQFAKRIKNYCSAKQIPCLMIAHTDSKVSDNFNGIINETNIRGSKTITNLVEFLYILQRFQIGKKFVQTLRIVKHRGQNPESKLYLLTFDQNKMLYTKDNSMNFEAFKEAYNERNKL